MLKALLIFCLVTPTVGCILMSMGAWRVHDDYLDGGLTFFVIITGLIGLALIAMLDKMD